MNTNLSVFTFGSYDVRIIDKNGEPWWVAKDVAEILGYVWKGISGTMPHVPKEWQGVCSVQTPSGTQEMAILSEQGLYFFLARSDKPRALPFQKWIAGEVIPSIRKTGKYSVSPEPNEPQPKLLKCSVNGNIYEFPITQPVKSVSCAKSGTITFYFFSEEQKSAKKEKNVSQSEPIDSYPTDLLTFFKENCRVIPECWVCSDDLYKRYLEWTKDNSIERSYGKVHFFRWLNKIFGKNVVRRQYRSEIGKERFWTYTGIALVEEDPFDPPESPPALVPTPAESAPSLKFPPLLPRSGPPLRHFRPPV